MPASTPTPAPTLMAMPLAGAGAATGPGAVGVAVREAVAGLRGGAPSLVLAFPAATFEREAAARAAAEAAGGAPVAGMTSNGGISAAGPVEDGCTAIAFGAGLQVGVAVAEHASRDPRGAARQAAREAFADLQPAGGHALLMLFIDTVSGDQAEAVAGAYDAVGARVPIAGGAAGGRDGYQLGPRGSHRDAVVAVGALSPTPIGVGIADGCAPCAVPAIVTRADGRVVLGLDGRPATDVYLEMLGRGGATLDDEEFERLAVMHPLAQPELSGDVRLRHVLGRAPGGGLLCATHIPANAAVAFTEQTPAGVVGSARAAVRAALEQLPGRPRAAVIFDCAGRKRAAGDAVADEVAMIMAAFGAPPPLAGLHTHGEIGRVRGAKGDRNHALVVVAFG